LKANKTVEFVEAMEKLEGVVLQWLQWPQG
jgi:hypothetical protein